MYALQIVRRINIDIVGVKGLKTIPTVFCFCQKKKKLYCSGNVRHFRNYYRGVTGCGTTENEIKINTSQVHPRRVFTFIKGCSRKRSLLLACSPLKEIYQNI